MKPYQCNPKKQDKKTKILVFFLTLFAFFIFFLSTRFPAVKAWLQLISAALLLIMIQISTRFLFTQYRYGLEDGHLLLSSRQGPREKHLGGIPLSGEVRILDRKAWEEEKKKTPIASRFSYCQNLYPEKPYYLIAPGEQGAVLLVFEPDETLLSMLKKQIQSLQK